MIIFHFVNAILLIGINNKEDEYYTKLTCYFSSVDYIFQSFFSFIFQLFFFSHVIAIFSKATLWKFRFFFFLFLFLFQNTHLHFSSYRYGSSYVPSVLRSIPKSTPNTLRSSCLCCAYYSNHALTFTCWCSRTTNPVIEVRWVYKEFESENWKKRNTISLKFFFTCFSLLFYVYVIHKKCSCGRMEEKFIGRKGDVIIFFFFFFFK